jgi:hypothetical protein
VLQTQFIYGAIFFLPFVPEFSAKFSGLSEFSISVTKKYFYAILQPSDYKTRHSTTAPLHPCVKRRYGIHCVTCWDFPAISVVNGWDFLALQLLAAGFSDRISVLTCRDFPALTFPA